ncbi:hydantoinase B/oxoprolinase family protein [Haloarcula nitratireducens]|uniref:Hydantoinase B/oxoprolinase family protein n=1 Tax=Haloarcula nitratireducens TaxID=2487749 RepID=A0AAW4P6A3_9EURY|nr:hydantoinase B/oxoprolinase family protein [Halomicroarcula nitratireducens]MBX0293287.1 hydantoinase B/oxoprolinase family protein [Halomicroarcula nitratireducens]
MTNVELDAIELEILRNQLESVAEEMGQVLIRGAFSPNITERRDCSTALFDGAGELVAQAEHIPVHLGAMPEAVDAVLDRNPEPGDVFVLNDPFEGGTHLPDVTLVSPIVHESEIVGYAVSRAHHADVGGMAPGSMPAGARDIQQEGLRIPPTRLVADGERRESVWNLLAANVRNPEERRADLSAQLAANDRGAERVRELLADHGDRLLAAFDAVRAYSRERVEAELREFPDGVYAASDVLDGDGVTDADIPIEVTVTVDGATLDVDFSGTAPQVAGNVNAPLSVAKSAVYFVVRSVTDPDVPPNAGCYDPVTVRAPPGSLLNPEPPAAVVGGNVETSQRVTDVVFRALAEAVPDRVPAAGQGTMNNVVVGGPEFSYYETVGGGMGASADADGPSGVQVGMTNTLNTPVEALEAAYPLRVEEYSLRTGSGGSGKHRGGDGLVRELTVEAAAAVSLLTERRRHAPWGLAGGGDGEPGRNFLDGEAVPAKVTREVDAGTTLRVETPGGGGYGRADEDETEKPM